jgi:hypothetical protein
MPTPTTTPRWQVVIDEVRTGARIVLNQFRDAHAAERYALSFPLRLDDRWDTLIEPVPVAPQG